MKLEPRALGWRAAPSSKTQHNISGTFKPKAIVFRAIMFHINPGFLNWLTKQQLCSNWASFGPRGPEARPLRFIHVFQNTVCMIVQFLIPYHWNAPRFWNPPPPSSFISASSDISKSSLVGLFAREHKHHLLLLPLLSHYPASPACFTQWEGWGLVISIINTVFISCRTCGWTQKWYVEDEKLFCHFFFFLLLLL